LLKKLLFIPPVLIGAAVLYFAVSGRQAPDHSPPQERARVVRVITAKPVVLVPRVTGFGSVSPANIWSAISQVSGIVVYVHPDLKKGSIIEAGAVLVRISPSDYKLAISQAEANIRSAEAKLAELKITEANATDILAIEKNGLKLREQQLARKQDLLERGTIAKAAFELEQRDTLAQRKKVQDVENSLRLLPTQRSVQSEQIAVYKSQLAAAKLNLNRTTVRLPFDARIAEVNVEVEQFAQVGSKLLIADSVDVSEVEAHIPISQFRDMLSAGTSGSLPRVITAQTLAQFVTKLGLEATVRLIAGKDTYEWPARFARISDTVDPKTRTIGAIVAVDKPYSTAAPGEHPPLSKGMFVEIEIRTNTGENKIVVPRSAMHGDRIYVVNADNRLEVRDVVAGLIQGNLVVMDSGLSPGERVIISDLIPAVSGMLLKAQLDQKQQARIAAEASGGPAQQ